jgi:hypothetical protein
LRAFSWTKTKKSDNHDFMKTVSIPVTEAARNFAECINRAHYQDTTFVSMPAFGGVGSR